MFAKAFGAGEDVLDGIGDWLLATALPSGPFTDTLGISGLGNGPVLGAPLEAAAAAAALRAPGGTYALLPRTTAPYLERC